MLTMVQRRIAMDLPFCNEARSESCRKKEAAVVRPLLCDSILNDSTPSSFSGLGWSGAAFRKRRSTG